jgi:SAM-dependent methyltransferase
VTESIDAAIQLITRCKHLRDEGRNEAVLRGEFLSWLRVVFTAPEDSVWVNHYTEGAEAATTIAGREGATRYRFIDTLVRSTVIEYESDLRQDTKWEIGYAQVKDYAAGIIHRGTPVSQVRGILSDTVDWYAFDIRIADTVSARTCEPEDITLVEVESIKASRADEPTAHRMIEFIRKHLAREKSRPLTSLFITTDLGLESPAYSRHVDTLANVVNNSKKLDPSVALATDLWSRFVDHLERQSGRFRTGAYVDELYVAILARLLCANILESQGLLSDDSNLIDILQGHYFEYKFRLRNMVEADYFGWTLSPPYIDQIIPVAKEIQRDLYAYDYSTIIQHDLLGRLLTQLARRTERKLLGQEVTPDWVAHALAKQCLKMVPQETAPRVVDICCGSGTILAEVLKVTRKKYHNLSFSEMTMTATGFDIDPLAVLLAKTTWVITLKDELQNATEMVTIPIFHADSLFAVTPVTGEIPLPGETKEIKIDLDNATIALPSDLIGPNFRDIFDGIVDWAYDEARQAKHNRNTTAISEERARELLDALCKKTKKTISEELRQRISGGIYKLTARMASLAIAKRNGIWAFILRNTYQPGLLAGQFNGVVSNPPWLAMSQFANNPYRNQLSARAQAYGIKPGGSAHLHLELATIHLLHAVDRYLVDGAPICCLVPGTIFNGQHHARFRSGAYLNSNRPIPLEIKAVWEIAPGTFKVRSAAIIGIRRRNTNEVAQTNPQGALLEPAGKHNVPLELCRLGTRTAWVLGKHISPVASVSDNMPAQGADLMPRPAVCIEILDRKGKEWRVRTPKRGDVGYFAVKDAKKLAGADFRGYVGSPFIHRMVQSLNLLPFSLDGNFTHVALPARRRRNLEWKPLDVAEIRTAGFNETARRFQRIDDAMSKAGIVKPLREKVDERGKLKCQVFSSDQYLVVNGAGGGISCAACLPITGNEDIVVDQTLYWRAVATEEEAWYRVGLLNSETVSESVRQFNPPGEFGERHLHTLPNRVIPPFVKSKRTHRELAKLAKKLSAIANSIICSDARIADPTKPIQIRRRILRTQLMMLPEYKKLENICLNILRIP